MTTRGRRADRDDRGTAVVEFVWLGILLLIPLVYLAATLMRVQAGAFAADTAARAAGRAYALAPDDASGLAAARAAAAQALSDQGLGEVPVRVEVDCTPQPTQCHRGTSVITVRIDADVDLPLVPALLGDGAASVAVSSRHTVPIGRYVATGTGP